MLSHKQLEPDAMMAFVNRSNRLLEKLAELEGGRGEQKEQDRNGNENEVRDAQGSDEKRGKEGQ